MTPLLPPKPKIPEILGGTSNGTDHFRVVRPEYLGQSLKVVTVERSGRSDQNVLSHLTKVLSPVPLFCILLARTTTKRTVAWVRSVQPKSHRSIGHVECPKISHRNFKLLLNGKRPLSLLINQFNLRILLLSQIT